MPKRVIDFDALWASDKIASCPAWAQAEYAWLYGLADASGSFELTNLRVIWGRVAAIRKDLTLERLEAIFQEFVARGLLFTWEVGGKRYGHWTGSDVPGRLPPPSWRIRLERLAPPMPKQQLAAYMSRYSSRCQVAFGSVPESDARSKEAESPQLNLGLEAAQAQGWDRNEKRIGEIQDTPVTECPSCVSEVATGEARVASVGEVSAEELLEIYERERGSLPAAAGLTPERRRQCRLRIRAGLNREVYAAAVRRCAATPFLAGQGTRGWRASFDWLIANDTNLRKVIEGVYDSTATREVAQEKAGGRPMDRLLWSEIHVGSGPIAAQCGARVKPEAIERMRAREAARSPI